MFIERIVHAKGIDRAQAEFDQVLMPTPAAVMEGARLLADGCAGAAGLGPLLVVDPGGATTDVHSVADGEPSVAGVIPQGLPEAAGQAHRRRRSRACATTRRRSSKPSGSRPSPPTAQLAPARVSSAARTRSRATSSACRAIADEIALDQALVCAAVRQAVTRHCGTVATVYTATGPVTVQHGKDLSGVGTVIGTGGALVHSRDPAAVLQMALASAAEPLSLRPRAPRLLLDREYLLYACGLLGSVEPQAALELALAHLEPIDSETRHERTRSA